MVRAAVQVLGEGAEALMLMLGLRMRLIGALGRKMATAAALAHPLGMTGALFTMMMIIMSLPDAVYQIKAGRW